jgi:hypothetical protein
VTEEAAWAGELAGEQWETYECVLRSAAGGPPFALGGAFALASHTGHLRNTKDLDIYVRPQDRGDMVEILTRCGLNDYHARLPYDRSWIYRGFSGDAIVDIIWGMPNLRAWVDRDWLSRGPVLQVRGYDVAIVPAEELIWCKSYVMQRERCDWPDVLNLLFHKGPSLDWHHLLARFGDDRPLLGGVLSLFQWLCPEIAGRFPRWLWNAVASKEQGTAPCGGRAYLLDTRPWFGHDFPRSLHR